MRNNRRAVYQNISFRRRDLLQESHTNTLTTCIARVNDSKQPQGFKPSRSFHKSLRISTDNERENGRMIRKPSVEYILQNIQNRIRLRSSPTTNPELDAASRLHIRDSLYPGTRSTRNLGEKSSGVQNRPPNQQIHKPACRPSKIVQDTMNIAFIRSWRVKTCRHPAC